MAVALLLLLSPLLHITNATVYYVTADDSHGNDQNNNFHTLLHYINNASNSLTSHTNLHFLPGQHHLNTDFIITCITNFTITGNGSTII